MVSKNIALCNDSLLKAIAHDSLDEEPTEGKHDTKSQIRSDFISYDHPQKSDVC